MINVTEQLNSNNGTLSEIIKTDRGLYTEMFLVAVARNMTTTELLKERGVALASHDENSDILKLKGALDVMATEGKVTKTKVHGDKELKKLLQAISKDLGILESAVLWEMGFKVSMTSPSDDVIAKILKELYPDGIVTGLHTRYPKLCSFITANAVKANESASDYISSLGLTFKDGRGAVNKKRTRKEEVQEAVQLALDDVYTQETTVQTADERLEDGVETTSSEAYEVTVEEPSIMHNSGEGKENNVTMETTSSEKAAVSEGKSAKYLAEVEALKNYVNSNARQHQLTDKILKSKEQSKEVEVPKVKRESDTKVLMDLLDVFPNKVIVKTSVLHTQNIKERVHKVAERNRIQPITLLKIWGFELLDYDFVEVV